MKTSYKAVLTGGVLFLLLQVTAHCGLKQSNYDKEREKLREEQHKDALQLQIQKIREDERAKRDKEREEIRRKYHDEYLLRRPTEFYNARVVGKYCLKDGKPVPFVTIEGQVHDILSEKRILVNIPAAIADAAVVRSPTIVLVILEKSQKLFRGQKFSIPNVIESGTYAYSKPDGTPVSARIYSETPGITMKEFLQLRKDGYRFPEETAD